MKTPYDKAPSWVFITVFAFMTFVLGAMLVNGQTTTIGDCLRSDAPQQRFKPNHIENMPLVNTWHENGVYVMQNGTRMGTTHLLEVGDDPEKRRLIQWWMYDGSLYAIVLMHPDNPNRRRAGEPASAWHGVCFGRVLP